jgi:hypothetical protein
VSGKRSNLPWLHKKECQCCVPPLSTTMATTGLIAKPSREEVWWDNFKAVKKHYDEHGNLTVGDLRLSGWVTYQRHEAKTLSNQQLEALQSIGYKSTGACREIDAEKWEEKFNAVKSNPHTKDPKVIKWMHRQRWLAATGRLEATRKQRLLEIKVSLQLKNRKGGKINSENMNEKKWMANYNKLKEYGDRSGDVNVPRPYPADPQLGNWVFNQRKRYHEVRQNGDRVTRKDRIELLEEIGFNWELNRRIGKPCTFDEASGPFVVPMAADKGTPDVNSM